MTGAGAFLVVALAAAAWEEPARLTARGDDARQLIFLADHRPVFLRLQVTVRGGPFDVSWSDTVRIVWASLDRDGNGTLTTEEADPAVLAAVVRLAVGAAEVPALGELDIRPKDGKISVDELAEGLRPILGPFRLQFGRQSIGRTDALFDQLDRNKDGELTRPELAAIAGSLRPLDLDDDEMVSALELEPYGSAVVTDLMEESSGRRPRLTALPPVIEFVAGESTFRPARLLLKKYDTGTGDVPGRPDNKLSAAEIAIAPDTFAAADTNGDDALVVDELRKLLAQPPVDVSLEVNLSPDPAGLATAHVKAGASLPKGTRVRQIADGDVEIAVGQVRLDIHVDNGNAVDDESRRIVRQQFKAADANKDGYLEGKELITIDAPQSPWAGLRPVIDRDGDGKVYLKELLVFADRQIAAASARLLATIDDQGRAIFGIVDLDRDRRLGAREVMRTVDRVMSWDANGDGRVAADEVPYHFQVNIARSGLAGLTGDAIVNQGGPRTMSAARTGEPATGPDWFQKMDRNHDGDVSRREFLGPRDQFDRLDRDDDGLIDPIEAKAAAAARGKDGIRP
jgi:Ca2+-binding EF-hand superfamily protein